MASGRFLISRDMLVRHKAVLERAADALVVSYRMTVDLRSCIQEVDKLVNDMDDLTPVENPRLPPVKREPR